MNSVLSVASIVCLVGSAVPPVAQERPDSPSGPIAHTLWREAARLAAGQSNEPPSGVDARWIQLQRLAVDEEIRVVLDDATSSRGAFRIADADSITLRIGGRDQRVQRARVLRVLVARGSHRRRNVLLGLVIGGTAGGLATAIHCKGRSSGCNEVAPAFVYPFAGAGTLIGALLPARDWAEVFRAERADR
jgi:hypothetical protein